MITVVRPGPLTTVQDLGRPGYAHLGVPRSGALDQAGWVGIKGWACSRFQARNQASRCSGLIGRAQDWTPMIFAGICLCLYIPVVWLLNGILTAYIESVWTLTYMRLTAKPQDNAPVVVEANA